MMDNSLYIIANQIFRFKSEFGKPKLYILLVIVIYRYRHRTLQNYFHTYLPDRFEIKFI